MTNISKQFKKSGNIQFKIDILNIEFFRHQGGEDCRKKFCRIIRTLEHFLTIGHFRTIGARNNPFRANIINTLLLIIIYYIIINSKLVGVRCYMI